MGQARLIVQQKKLPAKVLSKSWKRMKDHSYFFEPKRFRFHLHFRHLESEIGNEQDLMNTFLGLSLTLL